MPISTRIGVVNCWRRSDRPRCPGRRNRCLLRNRSWKRCDTSGQLLQLELVDLTVDHVHRGLGLRRRDAGLEPRHDRQPAAGAALEVVPGRRHLRLHRHRHHDVGVLADDDAEEAGRRHADDRHRQAVERDVAVQHAGIAGEAPHPVVVAQHRDRLSARRAIVVRREGAADLRAHAEDVEEVAGHELAVHALGLSAGEQRQRRREAGDHAVEHRVLIPQVAVHRVRQGAVVERPSPERAGAVEHDELLGRLHRQHPQQHLVGEREDRGVRADAERQRQHDDDGEGRRLEEGAQGVAEIAHDGGYHEGLRRMSRAQYNSIASRG